MAPRRWRRFAQLACVLALSAAGLWPIARLHGQSPGDQSPTVSHVLLPFVPNGETYGGVGPWYGTLMVQNVEPAPVTLRLWRPADPRPLVEETLAPHATRIWSAPELLGSGTGTAIRVEAAWADEQEALAAGGCAWSPLGEVIEVTRGTGQQDIVHSKGIAAGVSVDGVIFGGQPPVYGQDYTWRREGHTIAITWLPGGRAPQPGQVYYIHATPLDRFGAECPPPSIAGAVLIATPQPALDGRPDRRQVAVSVVGRGGEFPSYQVALVQTNNGWDTVLHLTNLDPSSPCTTDVSLYATGMSDEENPAFTFSRTLAPGETWHLDLREAGVPDGFTGWASWASGSPLEGCFAGPSVVVDRIKRVAGPDGQLAVLVLSFTVSQGHFAPLVFGPSSGWNTGIDVVGHKAFALHAFAPDGSWLKSVEVPIAGSQRLLDRDPYQELWSRGQTILYRPDLPVGQAAAVLEFRSGDTFPAVTDLVRYGEPGQPSQAMSYPLLEGVWEEQRLALPLVQRRSASGEGFDTTLYLFNAAFEGPATVELQLFDLDGTPRMAPAGQPWRIAIPAYGTASISLADLDWIPEGWQGSAVVTVVEAPHRVVGLATLVSDDVAGDGGAALPLTPLLSPARSAGPPSPWLDIDPSDAPGGHGWPSFSPRIGSTWVIGAVLIVDVIDGPNAGFHLVTSSSSLLPKLPRGGTDPVRVCWDLDGSTTCDPDEPEVVVPVTWAEQPGSP